MLIQRNKQKAIAQSTDQESDAYQISLKACLAKVSISTHVIYIFTFLYRINIADTFHEASRGYLSMIMDSDRSFPWATQRPVSRAKEGKEKKLILRLP